MKIINKMISHAPSYEQELVKIFKDCKLPYRLMQFLCLWKIYSWSSSLHAKSCRYLYLFARKCVAAGEES